LILVVLILAVAMVLITSALTITVAARDRYYNNALNSQASLTAASVAKAIASAACTPSESIKGDPNSFKAGLDSLAISGKTVVVTETTVAGVLSVSPGLAGDASGKTSYTDLTVEYSNDAKTNFKITVNTYLALSATKKSQQTVIIYLTKNIPVIPSGFGATLTVFGNNIQLPNVKMGYDAPINAESNFVTFTGTMTQNAGTSQFGGDVIVTQHIETNGALMSIKGNLVLLGAQASLRGDLKYSLPSMTGLESYFLDLCVSDTGSTFWNYPTDQRILKQSPIYSWLQKNPDPAPAYYFRPKGILLKNANMNFDSASASIDVLLPSTTIVNLIDSSESMKVLADSYTKPTGNVQESINWETPTTRAELMTLLGLSADYAAADMTTPKLKTKLEDDQNAVRIQIDANGKAVLPNNEVSFNAPAYYIDLSLGDKLADPILFDLANNNIDVFIVGNASMVFSFTSQDGGIRFIRPAKSTHIGRIIFMEDFASFDLSNAAGTLDGYAGITGAGMNPDRYSVRGGATIVDGSEPYIYIYGFNNSIITNTGHYVEGYYGLFGDYGKFTIPGGNNKIPGMYARFNVNNMAVTVNNQGEMPVIPYCPAPGEGTNWDEGNFPPFLITGYITS